MHLITQGRPHTVHTVWSKLILIAHTDNKLGNQLGRGGRWFRGWYTCKASSRRVLFTLNFKPTSDNEDHEFNYLLFYFLGSLVSLPGELSDDSLSKQSSLSSVGNKLSQKSLPLIVVDKAASSSTFPFPQVGRLFSFNLKLFFKVYFLKWQFHTIHIRLSHSVRHHWCDVEAVTMW